MEKIYNNSSTKTQHKLNDIIQYNIQNQNNANIDVRNQLIIHKISYYTTTPTKKKLKNTFKFKPYFRM